jgi:hypothetical protein
MSVPVQPDGSTEAEQEERATVAEVALRMLDWMGDHKTTWASAAGAWDMLNSLLPKATRLCAFSRVRAILVAHLDGRLRKIDICPCGYCAYMDCTSPAFSNNKYRNAHRTICPRCDLSRYVPDYLPLKARKVCCVLSRAAFVTGYNRH